MNKSKPIAFSLEQSKRADPWLRPYLMEALIRQGSGPVEVFDAFDATSAEVARTEDLLRQPSVYDAPGSKSE